MKRKKGSTLKPILRDILLENWEALITPNPASEAAIERLPEKQKAMVKALLADMDKNDKEYYRTVQNLWFAHVETTLKTLDKYRDQLPELAYNMLKEAVLLIYFGTDKAKNN